ncbi:MAG: hypothetical protein ACXVPN_11720 [Bacteroidia bacterium]
MLKKIIFSFLLCSAFIYANAQQDSLYGPHGGRIKQSQGYYLETLGCDNFMELYLYNQEMQPVFNSGISGTVKFYYDKKAPVYALQKYGIDGFTCKIESPDFFNYEVTMNLLDRLIITATYNECVRPKW